MIDTGSTHHYLPSSTAESLFHHPSLTHSFSQIHFAPSHDEASLANDSGWLQTASCPEDPIYLEFEGSNMKWPVSLRPPLEDHFASIRGSAQNRAILGMSFLSQLDGIIFDFTKGKERVGFITSREIPSVPLHERNRERWVQFLVGTGLALAFVGGFKWYNDDTD